MDDTPSSTVKTVWMLDSGAYTAWTKGQTISLTDYARFVLEHRSFFRGGVITMDVIGDRSQSYQNWVKMKKMGIQTIPVFHMLSSDRRDTDGYAYLWRYAENTNYIAIGALAHGTTEERMHSMVHLWEAIRAKGYDKTHKFHALGVSSLPLVVNFPWYSVDSAVCVKKATYGQIYVPKFLPAGGEDYTEGFPITVSDQADYVNRRRDCFFSYPDGGYMKERILLYVREMGFDMPSSLDGRKILPRVFERRMNPINRCMLFSEVPQGYDRGNSPTPANSFHVRVWLNYAFLNRLAKQLRGKGRRTKIYNVISSSEQIAVSADRAMIDGMVPHMMVSFWAITRRAINPKSCIDRWWQKAQEKAPNERFVFRY